MLTLLKDNPLRKFYGGVEDTVAEVSAGSGLIGGIWDAVTASQRQHDANTFALGMYDRQRADALADWNRQNAYNSPAAVMSRYKAAGLNPNLIYGSQGLVSPAIRSSSAAVSPPPTAPATMGKAIGGSISDYLDTKMKQAQIDNTQQMLKNMVQDNIEKQADIVRKKMENIILSYNPLTQNEGDTQTDKDMKQFYQMRENARYQANIDTTEAEAKLRERTAETQLQTNVGMRIDNAIKSATSGNSITLSTQKALQSLIDTSKDQQELENLKILKSKMLNDLELQKLDMDMQNGGLNAKSPFWQKILSGIIDAAMLAVPTGRGGGVNIPADGRLLQTRTYQLGNPK